MGGFKYYYANTRTIAISEKWNLRIRVTPAYNRNELPYFVATTPAGLWRLNKSQIANSENCFKSAYFHFKDSQMEFFKGYNSQWKVSVQDIEHIRETLTEESRSYPGYTIWQMACYWWNVEHEILDFKTSTQQYFLGLLDEINAKNRSYIPHDQKIPETWFYNPPRKIKKRLLIS